MTPEMLITRLTQTEITISCILWSFKHLGIERTVELLRRIKGKLFNRYKFSRDDEYGQIFCGILKSYRDIDFSSEIKEIEGGF